MKPKFEVVIHHPLGRTFHTNVEVTKSSINIYDHGNSAKDVSLKENEVVTKTIMDLLHKELVKDVIVLPYSVSVYLRDREHIIPRWDDSIDDTVYRAFAELFHRLPSKSMQVEKGLSTTLRKFHTNFDLSKSRLEKFERPIRQSSQEYLEKVGPKGAGLVCKTMKVPGVVEISIQPYEVMVEIAKLFNWEEPGTDGVSLTDKVKTIFEQVFGSGIVFIQSTKYLQSAIEVQETPSVEESKLNQLSFLINTEGFSFQTSVQDNISPPPLPEVT